MRGHRDEKGRAIVCVDVDDGDGRIKAAVGIFCALSQNRTRRPERCHVVFVLAAASIYSGARSSSSPNMTTLSFSTSSETCEVRTLAHYKREKPEPKACGSLVAANRQVHMLRYSNGLIRANPPRERGDVAPARADKGRQRYLLLRRPRRCRRG